MLKIIYRNQPRFQNAILNFRDMEEMIKNVKKKKISRNVFVGGGGKHHSS
jgi:dihydrofolate reductase